MQFDTYHVLTLRLLKLLLHAEPYALLSFVYGNKLSLV
jgi:hypothetical protein